MTEPTRNDAIKTSTLYFTESGKVEVPGEDIPIPDVIPTFQSNMAPLWLVFPKYIINTQNILTMERNEGYILFVMSDGSKYSIFVKDVDVTWSALQNAFANGLPA